MTVRHPLQKRACQIINASRRLLEVAGDFGWAVRQRVVKGRPEPAFDEVGREQTMDELLTALDTTIDELRTLADQAEQELAKLS